MKKNRHFSDTPSVEYCQGQPMNCNDMVNKYGTYEIQPTADTENEFPKIAQGLPKKEE